MGDRVAIDKCQLTLCRNLCPEVQFRSKKKKKRLAFRLRVRGGLCHAVLHHFPSSCLVESGQGPCQFVETAGHCRGSIAGLWDRDSWLGFQNPSIVVRGRKFASFYPVVRVGFQVLRNERAQEVGALSAGIPLLVLPDPALQRNPAQVHDVSSLCKNRRPSVLTCSWLVVLWYSSIALGP